MQAEAIESKWVPLAILGLSGFASWHPYPDAWPWVLGLALLLATMFLVRAFAERSYIASQPLCIAVTAYVAAKVVLPLLVIGSGAVGLLAGSDVWMEVAMLNGVLLAIASLI